MIYPHPHPHPPPPPPQKKMVNMVRDSQPGESLCCVIEKERNIFYPLLSICLNKGRRQKSGVLQLTHDTEWESDKNTRNHHIQESQGASPFPAGDHKATRNRKDSMTKTKIVSEYDQEIPQSQTADKPMAPRRRATQRPRDTMRQTKQSNQLSLPHQDDCKT